MRLSRFDGATAAGRTAERYRLAAWGALANFVSRAVGMLMMVLTVHWATPYLGVERFGVWATFASMGVMLSFLDLGVGNALVNRVAKAAAGGDAEALQRVVTSGVGWLALIGVATTSLLMVGAVTIPWGTLLKLSSAAASEEAREAAVAFSAWFGLNLLSAGLLKLLVGQQRSHEAHLISATGALLACVALWWACSQRVSIATLLVAGFGVRSVAGLVIIPLLRARSQLRLSRLAACVRNERGILKTGSLFLLLQIGTMVGWGSDSFLLAGLVGADQVAVFAIAQRLFQFASQPVLVLNAPLWAAYADAVARTDSAFVRSTLLRSVLVSVGGGGALAVFLLLIGPWLIPHWTQGAVAVPWTLLVLMASWTLIEAGGTAFGIYLNGAGIVREQVVVVMCFCAVALPLKVFATLEAGATGLVSATIVAYLATNIALYTTLYRRRVLQPLGSRAP